LEDIEDFSSLETFHRRDTSTGDGLQEGRGQVRDEDGMEGRQKEGGEWAGGYLRISVACREEDVC
jgi:hypothetical protein